MEMSPRKIHDEILMIERRRPFCLVSVVLRVRLHFRMSLLLTQKKIHICSQLIRPHENQSGRLVLSLVGRKKFELIQLLTTAYKWTFFVFKMLNFFSNKLKLWKPKIQAFIDENFVKK